jgi:hypothetical protein
MTQDCATVTCEFCGRRAKILRFLLIKRQRKALEGIDPTAGRQANLCVDQVNVVEDERNGLGREPPSTPGASEATSDDWWVHWSVSGRPRRPTSPNRIPCSARSSGHAPRWLMALYQHDLSITVSSRACPSRHQCPCRPLSRRIATRSRPHPTPASLRPPPRAALTPDSSASPSRRRRYASPRPALPPRACPGFRSAGASICRDIAHFVNLTRRSCSGDVGRGRARRRPRGCRGGR